MKSILILCTGNSCRSIMAEGLLNHYGKDRFMAFSAGSHPSGTVHPASLVTMKANGLPTEGYRSKSWDEFTSQPLDAVITVCDNAAGEACPIFFGAPVKAHWGVPDPAHFKGTDAEIGAEFQRVFDILAVRVKALVALPDGLDKATFAVKLNEIGHLCPRL
ncbi:MAG: arsenate reductase ArsC [Alphaproteobacteria bacterium]|nr:arsenate reductase ArsC [Alphaproteobacteria bacterium]